MAASRLSWKILFAALCGTVLGGLVIIALSSQDPTPNRQPGLGTGEDEPNSTERLAQLPQLEADSLAHESQPAVSRSVGSDAPAPPSRDDFLAVLEDYDKLCEVISTPPGDLELLPVLNPERRTVSPEHKSGLVGLVEGRKSDIAKTSEERNKLFKSITLSRLQTGVFDVVGTTRPEAGKPEPNAPGQLTASCFYDGQWVDVRVNVSEHPDLDDLVEKETNQLRDLLVDISDYIQANGR